MSGKRHTIVPYASRHLQNLPIRWGEFFPPSINLNKFNLLESLRSVYSQQAKNNINLLLNNFKPEIVHLHNIYHHLTPSILPELKKRGIPIVQTVGDYHLISPNYFMYHDGEICEITKPNKYYKAIAHKCVKGSYLKSLLEITEKYLYLVLGWERNYVDRFLAPSDFMRTKLIEYGIPENKVTTLPYFIDSTKYRPNYEPGKYILYFGRLSEEKGLKVLLKVMKQLPRIKLVIAGTGPQEEELRMMNSELGNRNVEFVGFKSGHELLNLIENCRFTVLPSVWYEVFGLSILESFACGKPVIASNIGGMPEVIDHGENGLLVKPDNVSELSDAIDNLWKSVTRIRNMGKIGRNITEKKYNKAIHYDQIMRIYSKYL